VNAELGALATKIVQLQKTLNQMNHHATEKTDCLAAELDSDNDETENENDSFNMQQLVDSMSFSF